LAHSTKLRVGSMWIADRAVAFAETIFDVSDVWKGVSAPI
jgi:hypothetical protein